MNIDLEYKSLIDGLNTAQSCLMTIKLLKQTKKLRMKPKTYILQQDIPFFEKGTEIKPTSALAYGLSIEGVIFYEWSNGLIENNPEYFKLKEEESCVFNLDKINHQIEKLDYAENLAIGFGVWLINKDYKFTYAVKEMYDLYLKEKSNEPETTR